MIYPETFEHKVGFTTVRQLVNDKCVSPLGSAHCQSMTFSTDIYQIKLNLQHTAEMLSIITGDNSFPITGLIDVTHQLKSIKIAGTYIQTVELSRVRRGLDLINEVWDFLGMSHQSDEQPLYPALCALAGGLERFPHVIKSIDRVLDCRTNTIKDNSSPQLTEIRHNLSLASGSINRAMRRVMSQAV
ncbi:MAG: hypothetical protein K2M65_02360, partial [Muribaculaceae bacterium]|nr:hypothetical protein [Muribaculaceae bacterium]